MSELPNALPLNAEIRVLKETFASGRFGEVVNLSTALILRQPDEKFAWRVLGAALLQLEDYRKALDAVNRSLLLDRNEASAWQVRGVALQRLGQNEAALQSIEKSVVVDTLSPGYLYNYGLALNAAGRSTDALVFFRRALLLDSLQADAWSNRARSLRSVGNIGQALDAYRHALSLSPSSTEALAGISVVLRLNRDFVAALRFIKLAVQIRNTTIDHQASMGTCLIEMGDVVGAVHYLQRVLTVTPADYKLLTGLAVALRAGRQLEASLRQFDRSIRIRPESHEILSNRGTALRDLARYEESLSGFETAIALRPNFVEGLTNRGTALLDLRRVSEAIRCFERAFAVDPSNSSALWNASLGCLAIAEFAKGWVLHEHRFAAGAVVDRRLPKLPMFTPTQTKSQRVLVRAEQGVGDEVMFASMIVDFTKRVESLVVQVDPRLVRLFRRSLPLDVEVLGIDAPVETIGVASQLAMGSLGLYVRSSIEDFDAKTAGYLRPDVRRVAEFREMLQSDDEKIIGISWRSTNAESAARRNIDLAWLSESLSDAFPRVKLVNLQYGCAAMEVREAMQTSGVEVWQHPSLDIANDLDGVAALISACDAVVTIGNTTAHLCGALGKPAYVLLPFAPSWRWMTEGSRTPWYAGLKLFRKRSPTTHWEEVVSEALSCLQSDFGLGRIH